MPTTRADLAAAGFGMVIAFNSYELYEADAGPDLLLYIPSEEAAYITTYGPYKSHRAVIEAESEARMLRTIAAGMTPGPGQSAMLSHANAKMPAGSLWSPS